MTVASPPPKTKKPNPIVRGGTVLMHYVRYIPVLYCTTDVGLPLNGAVVGGHTVTHSAAFVAVVYVVPSTSTCACVHAFASHTNRTVMTNSKDQSRLAAVITSNNSTQFSFAAVNPIHYNIT